jgi:hypothetical protein
MSGQACLVRLTSFYWVARLAWSTLKPYWVARLAWSTLTPGPIVLETETFFK